MKLRALIAAALFAVSVSASADTNPDHGRAQHGGIAVEVRDVDFEMVAGKGTVTIYVSDHKKPVSTSGAKGKVTVLNGTAKAEAPLAPAGDNKLEAKGAFTLAKGTKVVALVELPGRKPFNVRFAIP